MPCLSSVWPSKVLVVHSGRKYCFSLQVIVEIPNMLLSYDDLEIIPMKSLTWILKSTLPEDHLIFHPVQEHLLNLKLSYSRGYFPNVPKKGRLERCFWGSGSSFHNGSIVFALAGSDSQCTAPNTMPTAYITRKIPNIKYNLSCYLAPGDKGAR